MGGSLEAILSSLRRDRDLPRAALLRKAGVLVLGRLSAPLWLAECTQVGPRARTDGRPRIVNRGTIVIGCDVNLASGLAPVELEAERGARLELGDGCFVNFGTRLHASRRVVLGAGVGIGPWSLVSDLPDPARAAGGGSPDAQAIRIGDGAWLGARVTVLPGSSIGARATICAGSVVSGHIPDDAVAAGIPARVLRLGPGPPSSRPVEGGR